jgi:DNA-binding protein H-NS
MDILENSSTDGRHRMGSLDFSGISDDAGAQLVAGLKEHSTTNSEASTRRSAARPIPSAVAATHESSSGASAAAAAAGLSHTPPISNSFENQHFGKRPRAGSVSGRLRSASDLEDKGIIDRSQKAILKDLIISGDEELQAALDKYEKGDTFALEHMIRSGELASRHAADIDLLGDLDLDFLNVDDHFGDLGGTAKHPNVITDDDGIAHLESSLQGEEDDYLQLNRQAAAAETRFRSNSLAFGPLLGAEQGAAQEEQYGRWMDRELVQTRDGRVGSIASASADAPAVGGLAESLAQYAKQSKAEAKPLTKAQLAEQKKRERQEKKEQKEREKQEKKEQRERARAQKKERDALEKQERQKKKEGAAKPNKKKKESKPKPKPKPKEEEEEPEEWVSGTGRPRSLSDPNFTTTIDEFGLMDVERPDGWIGAYSPESRKIRIERFMAKRNHRVWTKKVKYNVRKDFADSRLRVKGRFVKKEDELLMRDLMSLT